MQSSKFTLHVADFYLRENSLRAEKDVLRDLKEKLCILWGDLGEQKSRNLSSQMSTASQEHPESSPIMHFGQPDVDTDDENESRKSQRALREIDANSGSGSQTKIPAKNDDPYHPVANNKGFTCCIEEYGLKVKSKNSEQQWEQNYRIFGVKID